MYGPNRLEAVGAQTRLRSFPIDLASERESEKRGRRAGETRTRDPNIYRIICLGTDLRKRIPLVPPFRVILCWLLDGPFSLLCCMFIPGWAILGDG